MPRTINCLFCGKEGSTQVNSWSASPILLGITPNRRDGVKVWGCRHCLRKRWRDSDKVFMQEVNALIAKKQLGSTAKKSTSRRV